MRCMYMSRLLIYRLDPQNDTERSLHVHVTTLCQCGRFGCMFATVSGPGCAAESAVWEVCSLLLNPITPDWGGVLAEPSSDRPRAARQHQSPPSSSSKETQPEVLGLAIVLDPFPPRLRGWASPVGLRINPEGQELL